MLSTPSARRRFADILREHTATLHRRAEQSGIIGAILQGQSNRAGYTLFLRNLLPAYHALEAGLERHREKAGMGALFRPEVVRGPAIESDLVRLAGKEATERLPLLPESVHYAARIAAASEEGAHSLLIAHAYTRYLGDLGGGPILKRRLATAFNLEDDCLSFYDFPQVTDMRAFAMEYRGALDAAAERFDDLDRVIDEAVASFHLNIALSEAVEAFVRPGASEQNERAED